jgi:hypothetical protein
MTTEMPYVPYLETWRILILVSLGVPCPNSCGILLGLGSIILFYLVEMK